MCWIACSMLSVPVPAAVGGGGVQDEVPGEVLRAPSPAPNLLPGLEELSSVSPAVYSKCGPNRCLES